MGIPTTIERAFNRAFPITPNDGADVTVPGCELNIAVAGNIKIDTSGGDDGIIIAVGVGHVPIFVDRVYSTSTTATGITGIYRS